MNALQKILIVDDRKENLIALRQVLRCLDVEVVEASSGNAALAATLDHRFALAILDVMMPEMSGFELAEHLRNDENTRLLPIIFITAAYPDELHIFSGYEAGGVDYIVKPYASEILLAKVKIFLELDSQRQELKRSNLVLGRAVEQSPVSVLITDTDGVIQQVNPKLCELTGYSPGELIGQNPRILQSGETSPETYQALWDTLLSGNAWRGMFHNKRKDGSLFWEQAVISPVRNDEGAVIQYVAVKEDISDRIRMEQDLQRAREDAECAGQAKLRFLQIMSHELRTPLNGILGALQILEYDKVYNAELTTSAKQALFSMIDIIDNMLEASRLESSELSFTQAPLQLELLLATLGRMFSVAVQNKGLHLRMSLAEDLPRRILTDAAHLKQIIAHLMSNAIKFTEQGTVEVRMNQESGGTSDRPVLRIDVRDTGIGIDPDKQQLVFALFTQGDDSLTRLHGGIGLGLTLTKRLAELMGGTIGLQSCVGSGTTVTVRLPLVQLP